MFTLIPATQGVEHRFQMMSNSSYTALMEKAMRAGKPLGHPEPGDKLLLASVCLSRVGGGVQVAMKSTFSLFHHG